MICIKDIEIEPVISWNIVTIPNIDQLLKIIEKTFSMLELWEKSKVYNSMDARNQREESVMELFQMLKKYDKSRYLCIKEEEK